MSSMSRYRLWKCVFPLLVSLCLGVAGGCGQAARPQVKAGLPRSQPSAVAASWATPRRFFVLAYADRSPSDTSGETAV